MSITILTVGKPKKIIAGENDERFATKEEAIECAKWLEEMCSSPEKPESEIFVYEGEGDEEGEWIVCWA